MRLSAAQMALMSRLLDEALPLDAAGRRAWLEILAPEYQELAAALRESLLPEDAQPAGSQALRTLPKLGLCTVGPASDLLQAGAHVGPYALMRLLGSGGMAQVWLARRADGAFKREVALKLPALTHVRGEIEERFVRERDILASLEHPRIARFYDAGVDVNGLPYLALEYVPGKPLTEWCDANRLPISSRLKLYLQVLDAVQYAHEKQIVHRDLKPSNILVNDSGEVRLLDFGVAKLLEEDIRHSQLTLAYGRALTADYASPELLRGDPIDVRSDVYSLGVVLYELLTGALPYRLQRAATLGMLGEAIGTVEVRKPSTQIESAALAARRSTPQRLPRELRGDLDAIVLKALAKSAANRYPSVATLAQDIRRYLTGNPVEAQPARLFYRLRKLVQRNSALVAVSVLAAAAILATAEYAFRGERWMRVKDAHDSVAAAAHTGAATAVNRATPVSVFSPPGYSIAVLPFVDLSEKKNQGYFADGIAEELIDLLTRIPGLRVIARTSSFSFKGRAVDVRSIGKSLGVAYIVEGSVRRSGDRIRVTAQLSDARSDTQVWSSSYERDFGDALNLEDQITEQLARAMQIAVGVDQLGWAHGAVNTDAYTYFLRGRAAIDRGDENVAEAKTDFLQALAINPEFSRAAEALALAYLEELADRVAEPSSVAWPAAAAAARRALQLDPRSALSHAILGLERATYAYDWAGATAELKATLALEPRDPYALYNAAWLAFDLGYKAKAVALQDAALALDPLNPDSHQNGAYIRYLTGDLVGAERGFRRSIEISPTFANNHRMLGEIYLQRHQLQAALKEMEAEPNDDVGRALVYFALGRKKDADQALARAERDVARYGEVNVALIHAYRGERDQAFDWLNRAVTARDINLGHRLRYDPIFAPLQGDPRFRALLRRMNLSE